jgi:hypothetical protein
MDQVVKGARAGFPKTPGPVIAFLWLLLKYGDALIAEKRI